MAKLNVNDTLQFITGMTSGYVGINAIPTITDHANTGNILTAVIGFATVVLQALIMKWNRKADVKRNEHTNEMLDLQRQITELKSEKL